MQMIRNSLKIFVGKHFGPTSRALAERGGQNACQPAGQRLEGNDWKVSAL